jgi:hypothetical protein
VKGGALNLRNTRGRAIASVLALLGACLLPAPARSQLQPVVPPDQRGRLDAERVGTHDAANIRTSFTNFGMVGDYPPDPGNVDLSIFHSVEVPKGSGLNYSDGITPFVLARIIQQDGTPAYIMETGFRERQANSPNFNRVMRFEPRPGYFQADPNVNRGRSPAISNDPRTWPNSWPNRVTDPDDPGWSGSWNGYFGKRPAADQESFTVMDDQFYDAWNYVPDSRDPSRKGLGLRVEVRGFQWSNPQAGNVIFWHYDITNESTTDYVDNIVFGLYMDSGVGGPRLSCDGIFESDDDNAFFDRTTGLNLVYTWDRFGHGGNLASNCARTGYLGYAYLETPGNPLDGADNDNDGITDELRDGGPGLKIVGQGAIVAYMAANYDTADFRRFYGPIENRPAFRVGEWWTGDEDVDWVAEFHDVGGDGVGGTADTGEGDGQPTPGEPYFDRTDLHESDQIGLTGFKQNRIRAGQGNPSSEVDGIVFYTDSQNWPQKLYEKFSDPNPPARFDSALAANYNIAFLFASGPFTLGAGKNERFSLALAFGGDLTELTSTVRTVQQIYDANYQFAVPPPLPTVTAEAGDGRVRLSWDDIAERGIDPVTIENDFEGYRIYRATDPEFRDPRLITTGRGTGPIGNGVPIAQFDLVNGKKGFSPQVVEGVAYWLGEDSGIRHTWTDTTALNGQLYYYAVCSYDRGSDSLNFYPSENSISVSRTPRGGTILPTNVAAARPNPRVLGWQGATATAPVQVQGGGTGTVEVQVVNTDEVPDGHLYAISFAAPDPDSVRATTYALRDSSDHRAVFHSGADFAGAGVGPPGDGLLPILETPLVTTWDADRSGFAAGSPTNTRIKASYQPVVSPNLRRVGYPDSLSIEFDDVVRDTGLTLFPVPARPAKFRVIAHTATGDRQLDFRFRDNDANNTLSRADEFIDVVTYAGFAPTAPQITWRIELDTLGQGARGPIVPPRLGDRYEFKILKPFGVEDAFTFTTQGQATSAAQAQAAFNDPVYVVPNPYVGSASFEPERFAVSGRGERRIEFRGVTVGCTIRIYTVTGNLVQTLRHDGSTLGFVPWNLRTKDNLDVAPGLYIFHAESPGIGTQVGKFAIIK